MSIKCRPGYFVLWSHKLITFLLNSPSAAMNVDLFFSECNHSPFSIQQRRMKQEKTSCDLGINPCQ